MHVIAMTMTFMPFVPDPLTASSTEDDSIDIVFIVIYNVSTINIMINYVLFS